MYYSLRGTLIAKEPNWAAIECAGVGYKVMISYTTAQQLPATGVEVFLYTHLVVREGVMDLYGFISDEELLTFTLMTTVSGVGPKAGLAILSELTPEQFALAVAGEDFKTITKAQGVGPKLAQRIVLELKDKLKSSMTKDEIEFAVASGASMGSAANEAIDALTVLGYKRGPATQAVRGLGELPTQELIKRALSILSGGKHK